MKFERMWMWTLLWVAAAAASVRGQAIDVLKAVPDDADAFAVVAKLSDLDKKASALAQKLNAPAVSFLDLAGKMLGIGKGVDVHGSAALAAYVGDGEAPGAMAIIPVTDYKELLASVKAKETEGGVSSFQIVGGKEMLVAKKGNYAFATPAQHQHLLVKVLKNDKNVTSKISAVEGWLKTQDFAVVVLEKTLKFGAKMAVEKIPDELPGVPEEQAKVVKAQLDWARSFAKSAGEEMTHAALGVRIDEALNAGATVHVGYSEKGRFAAWGKQRTKEHPLAGLPAGPYVFAFGGMFSPDTMKSLMGFSLEASKEAYKLSDAEAKELQQTYVDMMSGMDTMSIALRMPKQGEPLFGATVGVMRVKDSADYLKRYSESVKKLDKIMKTQGEAKPVKVAGKDAVEVTMDMKAVLQGNNDPNAEMMLEKMFGSGTKMTVTMAAADPQTVIFSYLPASKMKGIVESFASEKQLRTEGINEKTLKNLVADPFFTILWSPKETAELVRAVAKDFGQELPIPAVGQTPPIGIAGRATATTTEIQLLVPVEVIEEIGKLYQKLLTQ
ncbi:MAG: hypothetical protein K2X38_16990 [Gemmataceae bacterium]|nr:hypothetical protein [Gemmataceae bacterium]